jgi:uncharacterized protein involved in exopolysaccharide biosynthesis
MPTNAMDRRRRGKSWLDVRSIGEEMDFWRTLGVLLRRWYVALPALAVSLGLAGAVFLSVHTDYESTSTIVLASPTDGARVQVGQTGPQDRVNPMLAFDGSLITSAQIIIQKLQDPAIAKQLLDPAGGEKYQVGNGQLSGPFIVVVATAHTPNAAHGLAERVVQRARTELTDSQQTLKAPATTFITVVPVVAPTPAEAKIGGKTRYAGVALVLGLISSLGAAYAAESIMDARRRRHAKIGDIPANRREEQSEPATQRLRVPAAQVGPENTGSHRNSLDRQANPGRLVARGEIPTDNARQATNGSGAARWFRPTPRDQS